MKLTDLFTSPDKWTKGCSARDSKGVSLSPTSCNAVSFCLLGGMQRLNDGARRVRRVRRVRQEIAIREAIRKLYPKQGTIANGRISIAGFNDHPDVTFEMIQDVIREANV